MTDAELVFTALAELSTRQKKAGGLPKMPGWNWNKKPEEKLFQKKTIYQVVKLKN